MKNRRGWFALAALSENRALAIGGVIGLTVELFDIESKSWAHVANISVARRHAVATTLLDSRVLVAGGAPTLSANIPLSAVEIYDPAANVWERVADMGRARYALGAVTLQDRRAAFGRRRHSL
jgi:N-acetylneuraminic acid mutarotase